MATIPAAGRAQPRRLGKWWLMAAAATSLLLITYFWWSNNQMNGVELFAVYNQPYPNTVSPITKGDDTLHLDGYQAYEVGRYDQAKILLANIDSDTARFYLALAHLSTENLDQAEEIFDGLMTNDNYYRIPAIWYLSLIDLKHGKISSAKAYLEVISSSDHPISRRATRLQEKLR